MDNSIKVLGARENNLKNIDVTIPRDALVVVTGVSGSGKSSLAFNTLYAEGQRRYIETFSAYARNFIGNIERPDVDKIEGLSPVIAIEQKTTNRNPRSTVGTTTEVYDFLRLFYARCGEAYSYVTGEKMVSYTEEELLKLFHSKYNKKKCMLLAPLVAHRKGHYRELFEQILKKGYLKARVDGEVKEIGTGMMLDRYKYHSISVVVDQLTINDANAERLKESLRVAMKLGKNTCEVLDVKKDETFLYSNNLICPTSGISYKEPDPNNFSFNSIRGYCPHCQGLGFVAGLNPSMHILSSTDKVGDVFPMLKKMSRGFFADEIEDYMKRHNFKKSTPVNAVPIDVLEGLLWGEAKEDKNEVDFGYEYYNDEESEEDYTYEGLLSYALGHEDYTWEEIIRFCCDEWKMPTDLFTEKVCPQCKGKRLNKEALHYFINGKNIVDLSNMNLSSLQEWLNGVEDTLSDRQKTIGTEILKEIRNRVGFMVDVGLGYLSLSRPTGTLSGGESQRIRLATQIGSQLVNVLYILDEPSIGLHQRDNDKLIQSLKKLRDSGNSVVVVEHDKELMLSSDWIVDLGPRAGRFGGNLLFSGEVSKMLKTDTLTASYLKGEKQIEIPQKRREGSGKSIVLEGATGNNLKNVTLTLPLGKFVCITGVSGSGKSSLINGTLYPLISKQFYSSSKVPLPYKSISGLENIDKIISVDQSPIGKTPRSNPATYTGVFADIRNLMASLPEAKIRGYKVGRFSFNVKGGRCEACNGNGYKTIEMNFLPDVYVPCEECSGKRYNRETLEVRFKGKSISDILDMTINQAVEFFENIPTILRKIKVLQDVGMGYIKLGQSCTTLSGGESQRVKLATELSKRDTGKTLYLLDEPTTGLHFEDINALLGVINRLVDKGNTVVVIEHNLDIIKCADHIIDLGPDGGEFGGEIVVCGTPEEVVSTPSASITAPYLRKELETKN